MNIPLTASNVSLWMIITIILSLPSQKEVDTPVLLIHLLTQKGAFVNKPAILKQYLITNK